jgi:hypothetical protein
MADLSYKLRPEQVKLKGLLEAAPTDLAVFNISRRFGKSTTCALFCVEQALKKKQNIRYATAFLTDLENFISPIFEWILSDCPDSLRPEYMASKKQFEFKNGSVIKLIGLDRNENALRGNAIDILIVDEAGFVSKLDYLYKSIIIPATMNRKFKLIFPSTPPESPEHFWASELVEKAKDKGTYVHLTIDDISDLPAAERKRLMDEVGGENSATAQREFFGVIKVDGSRSIAPSFTRGHVTDKEFEHIYWRLFGDTGGVRDKTVFLKVGYDHDLCKIIFREEMSFDPGTPTQQIVNKTKADYPGMTLTMDAPSQLLIDYSAMGLPASFPQKDDFGAGLLLLNNHFHNDRVLIHKDCKLLIRTLEGGLLNKNRTDYERTHILGHADACAAAIYALRGVDKLTDLRPRVFKSTADLHRPGRLGHHQNYEYGEADSNLMNELRKLTGTGPKSDW